jgi:hypothetical protein
MKKIKIASDGTQNLLNLNQSLATAKAQYEREKEALENRHVPNIRLLEQQMTQLIQMVNNEEAAQSQEQVATAVAPQAVAPASPAQGTV